MSGSVRKCVCECNFVTARYTRMSARRNPRGAFCFSLFVFLLIFWYGGWPSQVVHYASAQRNQTMINRKKKMGCVPNCTRPSVSFSAAHLLFVCAALILPWVVLSQISYCRFTLHQKGQRFFFFNHLFLFYYLFHTKQTVKTAQMTVCHT